MSDQQEYKTVRAWAEELPKPYDKLLLKRLGEDKKAASLYEVVGHVTLYPEPPEGKDFWFTMIRWAAGDIEELPEIPQSSLEELGWKHSESKYEPAKIETRETVRVRCTIRGACEDMARSMREKPWAWWPGKYTARRWAKELPEPYDKLFLERFYELGEYDDKALFRFNDLSWDETPEGIEFWNDVHAYFTHKKGALPPIPRSSLEELGLCENEGEDEKVSSNTIEKVLDLVEDEITALESEQNALREMHDIALRIADLQDRLEITGFRLFDDLEGCDDLYGYQYGVKQSINDTIQDIETRIKELYRIFDKVKELSGENQ